MIKIKTFVDINCLSEKHGILVPIVKLIEEDLEGIMEWAGPDVNVKKEEFDAEILGYGYIILLDGTETMLDYIKIGLSEGLEAAIPEAIDTYFVDGSKWTRIVVVYNDSFAMAFWLKDSRIFEEYELKKAFTDYCRMMNDAIDF